MKKRFEDEKQIIKAGHRQSIIITIFSNVTCMLCLLVFLIRSIAIKGPKALDFFFALCIIFFGLILFRTIQNLKRFDRL